MEDARARLQEAGRIVVKVGTSTLAYGPGRLNLLRIEKLVRELALLLDGLENGGAALLEFAVVGDALLDLENSNLVEIAVNFLSIARNEGNRVPVRQQPRHRGRLRDRHACLFGDAPERRRLHTFIHA